MIKLFQKEPAMSGVITDRQRKLNSSLHQTDKNYGNRSDAAGMAKNLPIALKKMHENGACNSLLDYGTGKGKLIERLHEELPKAIKVKGYDPSIPKYAEKPIEPVDILTCLDVLEHIEMGSIDAVLKDIHSLTKGFCYLVIDLQPAVKKLADGRNAHILLAPPEWWIGRISQLFSCQASFPIMHAAGIPQKLVIAACHRPEMTSLMYMFLVKLKINSYHLNGGILHGVVQQQKHLELQ